MIRSLARPRCRSGFPVMGVRCRSSLQSHKLTPLRQSLPHRLRSAIHHKIGLCSGARPPSSNENNFEHIMRKACATERDCDSSHVPTRIDDWIGDANRFRSEDAGQRHCGVNCLQQTLRIGHGEPYRDFFMLIKSCARKRRPCLEEKL